ncbi:NitT/TauT family transport system permease protein [Nakamurella panacisegetis]|uniref:NitT/TauT family transport system permease protein n=1 Tax=Nakamurella panacisegetis TaxID=1090615 RepID=A0A1H0IDD4_9ACTN|nr:ABC transporter permease [Nakamurella panacisegetis]SDO29091.1 NitT/TauT family transport system permease protein [Nakamurella panacisegetis]
MPTLDLNKPGAAVDVEEPVEREDTAAVGAGLDALESHVVAHSPVWKRFLSGAYPPLIALIALLGLWQFAYAQKWKPDYVLPSPSSVWTSFAAMVSDGSAFTVIWTSISRGLIGFAASIVLGSLIGVALFRFRWLRSSVGPLLTGLQSLPSVSWVPMAVLWFGLTNSAIYAVVLLGAVPSIANGLLSGMDQVPPLLTRVGKVLGLGPVGLMKDVLIPASLPGYLSGLRQGWAFSWRSLMAAELIATSSKLGLGLGQLLDQGRDLGDAPTMYTALILIFFVGIGVELIFFRPVERAILVARGLTPGAR